MTTTYDDARGKEQKMVGVSPQTHTALMTIKTSTGKTVRAILAELVAKETEARTIQPADAD